MRDLTGIWEIQPAVAEKSNNGPLPFRGPRGIMKARNGRFELQKDCEETIMSFGESVRTLRKKADYTQEMLAELLGISPQAVSRWECDSAMPDVSLLPRLAYLFGVSTDTLLGVDLEKRDRDIGSIREAANRAVYDGNRTEGIRILREGLEAYPNSHVLMAALADALLLEGQLEESLSLAEWVIGHESEMKLKADAISTASCVLDRMGRHSQAVELAKKIPELGCDDLLIHLLRGSERIRELRHKALIDGTEALYCLACLAEAEDDGGEPAFSSEERRKVYERLLSLYDLFFPEGEYFFYAQFPARIHRKLAQADLAEGREEEALFHLRECVRFGRMFEQYDPEAERTSLFFRGEADGGWVRTEAGSEGWDELREWLSDPLFDGIRDRLDEQD